MLRLPAIYSLAEVAEEGGFVAYGPRLVQIFRELVARQLVQLLRGVKPADIPIEQRDPREVTHGFGRQTAPDGVAVYNPAFDVTPARLIAGLITEKGLIQPVMEAAIRERLGA